VYGIFLQFLLHINFVILLEFAIYYYYQILPLANINDQSSLIAAARGHELHEMSATH